MSLSELQEAYRADTEKTRNGGYGYCKCSRPGYDRQNPSNCRICQKPFKHIYIEAKNTAPRVTGPDACISCHGRGTYGALRRTCPFCEGTGKEPPSDNEPFDWLNSL